MCLDLTNKQSRLLTHAMIKPPTLPSPVHLSQPRQSSLIQPRNDFPSSLILCWDIWVSVLHKGPQPSQFNFSSRSPLKYHSLIPSRRQSFASQMPEILWFLDLSCIFSRRRLLHHFLCTWGLILWMKERLHVYILGILFLKEILQQSENLWSLSERLMFWLMLIFLQHDWSLLPSLGPPCPRRCLTSLLLTFFVYRGAWSSWIFPLQD